MPPGGANSDISRGVSCLTLLRLLPRLARLSREAFNSFNSCTRWLVLEDGASLAGLVTVGLSPALLFANIS